MKKILSLLLLLVFMVVPENIQAIENKEIENPSISEDTVESTKSILEKITKLVEQAEENQSEEEISSARKYLKEFENSEKKSKLLNRLDKLEVKINREKDVFTKKKKEAKSELEKIKVEDYRQNTEEFKTVISNGESSIDQAETEKEIEEAMKETNKMIDQIETDKEVEIIKEVQKALEDKFYSKQALLNYLEKELDFTQQEALYGIKKNEVNWEEQAVKTAKKEWKKHPFSKEYLVIYLEEELYFSSEESEEGVQKAFKEIKKNSSGWKNEDSKWYFYNETDEKQSSWQYITDNWYYFNSEGLMSTGWIRVNDEWFYADSSGAIQKGWLELNDESYYFNENGWMQMGWVEISGDIYYLTKKDSTVSGAAGNGVMQQGWQEIDNTWYYFSLEGVLEKDATLKYPGDQSEDTESENQDNSNHSVINEIERDCPEEAIEIEQKEPIDSAMIEDNNQSDSEVNYSVDSTEDSSNGISESAEETEETEETEGELTLDGTVLIPTVAIGLLGSYYFFNKM